MAKDGCMLSITEFKDADSLAMLQDKANCNFSLRASTLATIFWLQTQIPGADRKMKIRPIDLFGLYILFSHHKSYGNTQEDWFFVLLIKKSAYKHEYACMHFFNEQTKGPNLLSISTWFALGKQNVQAKKVYCVHWFRSR